jgi:NTP pyrophosphatase (non-canonical NTP hydrolase)
VDLNEYQKQALNTAIYPGKNTFAGLTYTALKLNGEAGEIAEKVGKAIRDGKHDDWEHHLVLELGDVLWYISAMAQELGYPLEIIALTNLQKLSRRKQRGTLNGSGDDR